jgi:hypothetical protein
MKRAIAAVVAGLCTWIVVATVLNLLMRVTWADYAAAEASMNFALGMQVGRLVVGAVASLAAGFVAAWIAPSSGMPVKVLGVVILLMFLPVHYNLWDKFPIWYHAVFLGSLIPFTLLGAALKTRSAAAPA